MELFGHAHRWWVCCGRRSLKSEAEKKVIPSIVNSVVPSSQKQGAQITGNGCINM
uniref:Uncharacterized protein n=1 Tax=Anguilla anguilla TaxID=7936 RepID=A0A0E9SDY3_ANGAN